MRTARSFFTNTACAILSTLNSAPNGFVAKLSITLSDNNKIRIFNSTISSRSDYDWNRQLDTINPENVGDQNELLQFFVIRILLSLCCHSAAAQKRIESSDRSESAQFQSRCLQIGIAISHKWMAENCITVGCNASASWSSLLHGHTLCPSTECKHIGVHLSAAYETNSRTTHMTLPRFSLVVSWILCGNRGTTRAASFSLSRSRDCDHMVHLSTTIHNTLRRPQSITERRSRSTVSRLASWTCYSVLFGSNNSNLRNVKSLFAMSSFWIQIWFIYTEFICNLLNCVDRCGCLIITKQFVEDDATSKMQANRHAANKPININKK